MTEATKRCPECLADIPVKANRCMHCGSAMDRGRGLGQVVGAIFILIIAFGVIYAFTPWLR